MEKEDVMLILLIVIVMFMVGLVISTVGNELLYKHIGCGVLPHSINGTNADWYWDCRK